MQLNLIESEDYTDIYAENKFQYEIKLPEPTLHGNHKYNKKWLYM